VGERILKNGDSSIPIKAYYDNITLISLIHIYFHLKYNFIYHLPYIKINIIKLTITNCYMFWTHSAILRKLSNLPKIVTLYFPCNYNEPLPKVKHFIVFHSHHPLMKNACWRTSLIKFFCAAFLLWCQCFVCYLCSLYGCWCGVIILLLCAPLVCMSLCCWTS
jgi:hypothetical protein